MYQRDFVATMALQGLLASGEGSGAASGNKDLIRGSAQIAYQLADAMIEESRKLSSESGPS
jgi:hypothetical protein